MIIWMLVIQPFKEKLISIAHIGSETGFLIYSLTLYIFLSKSMETNARLFYGRIILWGLIALIVINWFLFVGYLVNMFYTKRKLKKARELEEIVKKVKEDARRIRKERVRKRLKRVKILKQRELKRIKKVGINIIYI